MLRQNDNYADLLHQIRNDLLRQHPEWIESDGQCPMCDSYEARLIKLLDSPKPGERSGQLADAFVS
jgi:hypothetical protein